jgi:Na+-transporting NADH:ubiquinone oxidoreductase subunit NqrF
MTVRDRGGFSFLQVTAPAFECDYSRIDVPEAHKAVWETLRSLKVTSTEDVTTGLFRVEPSRGH